MKLLHQNQLVYHHGTNVIYSNHILSIKKKKKRKKKVQVDMVWLIFMELFPKKETLFGYFGFVQLNHENSNMVTKQALSPFCELFSSRNEFN